MSIYLLLFLVVILLVVLVLRILPDRALRTLGRAYLLRIPLLTAFGLIAFCVLAWRGGARSLLGGIFDVGDSWFGVFFVSLTAFFAAWVVMATWRLVRLYGPLRNPDLDVPQAKKAFNSAQDFKYLALYYVLVLAVALPPILLTMVTSEGSIAQWLAVGIGIVVSLLCIVAVVWIQLRFTRPEIAIHESPDLFLPTKIRPFRQLFDRAREDDLSGRSEARAERLTSKFEKWPEDVFRGYFEYGRSGTDGWCRIARSILPGHVAAFILFLLTLVAYAVLGVVKYYRLGAPPLVPKLCYVLLLATLLCWALFGLAFFLDRYRMPVLIPVAAWLAVTSFLPWSDFYYPVKSLEPTSEVAAVNDKGTEDGSIIVVAVNGGGIQAAAWSARVLTGLEKKCRKECDRQFDRDIALISSVSGGSIGTMYFVNEYKDGRIDPNTKLSGIVDRAEGSSIDEISWGVLYPDLLRSVLSIPIPWGWDRGRALEEAWLRNDIRWDTRLGIEEGLYDWRADTENGDRSAVIFNTTITETGQRLPLATTDLPEGSPGRLNYDQLFEERKDVPVVTATRLSASFPYVSPAARAADIEGPASHIVDGGYYDNYGISSLVEWLDAKLRSDQDIEKVLIIEIRGAPSPPTYANDDARGCPVKPSVDAPDRKSEAGWFYQYAAPLLTVLGVRDTGQRAHNDLELDLLVDKWDEQDEENEQDPRGKQEPHRVEIKRALFEFDRHDVPLSWHLTAHDKQSIEENWHEELSKRSNACAGWKQVKAFLTDENSAK